MMTKYYAGTIEEINGEREYRHHVFFMLKDDAEPYITLDEIAKTWYGDSGELVDDGYWFADVTVYTAILFGPWFQDFAFTNKVSGLSFFFWRRKFFRKFRGKKQNIHWWRNFEPKKISALI